MKIEFVKSRTKAKKNYEKQMTLASEKKAENSRKPS